MLCAYKRVDQQQYVSLYIYIHLCLRVVINIYIYISAFIMHLNGKSSCASNSTTDDAF